MVTGVNSVADIFCWLCFQIILIFLFLLLTFVFSDLSEVDRFIVC